MFVCTQDSEQKDYINVKGCVPQFEKWLQDNLTLVAGIFIGVALLQVGAARLRVSSERVVLSGPSGFQLFLFLIRRFLAFVWLKTW